MLSFILAASTKLVANFLSCRKFHCIEPQLVRRHRSK